MVGGRLSCFLCLLPAVQICRENAGWHIVFYNPDTHRSGKSVLANTFLGKGFRNQIPARNHCSIFTSLYAFNLCTFIINTSLQVKILPHHCQSLLQSSLSLNYDLRHFWRAWVCVEGCHGQEPRTISYAFFFSCVALCTCFGFLGSCHRKLLTNKEKYSKK